MITRHGIGRIKDREQGDARGAFQAELEAQGLPPRVEVEVTTEPAPEDVDAILRAGRIYMTTDEFTAALLAAPEPVITRRRRMYAGDSLVQLATSWIPLDIAAGTPVEQEDTGVGGTYSRLADLGHAPVKFTEVITAELHYPKGVMYTSFEDQATRNNQVFVIRRVARDASGRAVEVTDAVLPMGEWELSYTWEA